MPKKDLTRKAGSGNVFSELITAEGRKPEQAEETKTPKAPETGEEETKYTAVIKKSLLRSVKIYAATKGRLLKDVTADALKEYMENHP